MSLSIKFLQQAGLLKMEKKGLLYTVCTSMIIVFSIGMLTIRIPEGRDSKPVFLYDKGFLDWSLSVFGRYGFERIGMFGLLPKYLMARGYTVEKVSSVSFDSLKKASILVMIDLDRVPDIEERKAIWDFVDHGGSLLILGDHTGHEHIRKPFNSILEPFGIAFNFDSAIPLRTKWVHGYHIKSHPIFHGLGEDDLQIGIGAALAIKPPARAVLVGRSGFSDKGNLLNQQQGYLGDMKFTRGEQLGDLTLVAEACRGKGKVLVFGDTSTFQNGAFLHSSGI